MMKIDNPFDKSELRDLLNSEYHFTIDTLTFLPKGEDGYAYLAQSRTGEKYFVKLHGKGFYGKATSTLNTILALTVDLSTRGDIPIVCPVRTKTGGLAIHWRKFPVAVFPFIDGKSRWELLMEGKDLTNAELSRVATLMAAIHQWAPRIEVGKLPTESFDLPFRDQLLKVLNAAEKLNDLTNESQRQLLESVAASATDIVSTLERLEEIRHIVRAVEKPFVITHGDPSSGNILLDDQNGLHIIDWDGAAFGPPERDLVSFTGERFERFLSRYLR